MKLIIAIVPSYKLEDVIQELDAINITRKTVSTVLGIGKSHTEVYRGSLETGNLEKKIRFEIAVNDSNVEPVIRALLKGANNPESDGKIFVLPLEDCYQVGTSNHGEDAIGQ